MLLQSVTAIGASVSMRRPRLTVLACLLLSPAAASAEVVLQTQTRMYSVHALNDTSTDTFAQPGSFVRAASAYDSSSQAAVVYQEDSFIGEGLIRLDRQIGAGGGFHGASAEGSAQFISTFRVDQPTPFDLSLRIWQNFNYQGLANATNHFVFSSPTAGLVLDSNNTDLITHISGTLAPATYTITFTESAGAAGTGSFASWDDTFVLTVPAPASTLSMFAASIFAARRKRQVLHDHRRKLGRFT